MENTFMVDDSAEKAQIAKLGLDPNSTDTEKDLEMRKIAAGISVTSTIEELIAAETKQGRMNEDMASE